jgi:hypothetical protein
VRRCHRHRRQDEHVDEPRGSVKERSREEDVSDDLPACLGDEAETVDPVGGRAECGDETRNPGILECCLDDGGDGRLIGGLLCAEAQAVDADQAAVASGRTWTATGGWPS